MIPQNNTNEKTLPEINIKFINAIRELKISALLKQSNICKNSRSRNGDGGGAAIRTLLSVDCDGNPSEPDRHDIGILASFDPIALDQTALVVRIISYFLCGITAGLLIRIFYRKKAFFNFNGFEEPKNRDRYGYFNPYLSLFWAIRLIL